MRVLMAMALFVAVTSVAHAASLKRIDSVVVPGEPLDNFDISFVDTATGRYYLADRSNKALDVFDADSGKFISRVGGFIGVHNGNAHSGPNGVVIVGKEAWVTDGDSTVKVIDLDAGRITDTISTGGKARGDEVAYDPKDHVFITANNADEPPFLTLISTEPGHRVLGHIALEHATDGLEQAVYVPAEGRFYVAVPQVDHDPHAGGIALIDPVNARLDRMIPVADCAPAGLASGPGTDLVLGCNAGGPDGGLAPRISMLDTATGKVVASVSQVGAADMVAYSPTANQYYIAARQMPGGSVLGVIDAATRGWVANVPTGGNAHSVAVSPAGHVLVPLPKTGGGCGGCIAVFGPAE